ncbi:MAG TPA: T9SS type A sorting domain-containing protein, partial [Saprospiraceae bacterium]|nr:T9SS type A sorting domain-containing protein [Saprospiraceae bacterium]
PCPPLAPPQSLGDVSMCKGSPLPLLSVQVNDPATETVDWYDGAGNLLKADTSAYQPTAAQTATYFAQTRYKFSAECVSTTRTAVTLTVYEPVVVKAGADLEVCAGEPIHLDGSISGGIGTGAWSAPVGSFSPSATALKAIYLPPPGISSVALTLRSDDPAGPCPDRSDLLLVQIRPLPTFEEKSRACTPSLLQYQVEFAVPITAQVSVNLSSAQFIGAGLYRVSGIPRDSNLQVLVKDPDTGCEAPFIVYTDGCPCPSVAAPTQPNNPVICPEDALPLLSVKVPSGQTADWYDAAGNLLQSDTLFFLPPGEGTYYAQAQVTVNQCTSVGKTPVTLTIKPSPLANAGPDAAICPGDSITLVSVGQHDTYLWSTGAKTPGIRVSPAATQLYLLTVTQSQCADVDTVRVTVRDSVVGSIQLLSPIKCFGDANGQIRAIATGGTSPYGVLWSVMSGAPVLSNLAAGVYTATISDAPGCTDVVSYELTQPARLQIVTHTIQNETAGGHDGSISVTVGGGTMPYGYQWTDASLFNIPGATLSFLGGQVAGVYFVRVTDDNGCMLLDSFQIKKSSAVGLFSDPAAQVLLFPNPTDGHLSLSLVLPETRSVAVEISDLLGRVLLSSPAQPMQERHLEYDLSAYPAGPYLLRLRVGDEVFTRKVIVQR